MEEILLKYVPESSRIKIVGTLCFAGGVHSIAFRNPKRICASAFTDYRSVGFGGWGFSKAFWNEVKRNDKAYDFNRDRKTSLYEAHLAGSSIDLSNKGRGQLSSIAYVDYIMKAGAYAPLRTRDWSSMGDSLWSDFKLYKGKETLGIKIFPKPLVGRRLGI